MVPSEMAASKSSFDGYLAIDFAVTSLKDMKINPQEIIEIAVQLVDAKTFTVSKEFTRYVKPLHRIKLTPYCVKVTGMNKTPTLCSPSQSGCLILQVSLKKMWTPGDRSAPFLQNLWPGWQKLILSASASSPLYWITSWGPYSRNSVRSHHVSILSLLKLGLAWRWDCMTVKRDMKALDIILANFPIPVFKNRISFEMEN